jgi:hypothetical protein
MQIKNTHKNSKNFQNAKLGFVACGILCGLYVDEAT